jgi:tetratricopeptide (TPR) repeat protein
MDILLAIDNLSDQAKNRLRVILKDCISVQAFELLEALHTRAKLFLTVEEHQYLGQELEQAFKNETILKKFLNHEKENQQTIGQIIFGDNIAIAKGYGVVISAPVMGDVNITHNHIDKPVPRILTTTPQIDTSQVVGRDTDVAKIKDLLKVSDKVLLMNGLGGIGKTTVAKVFLKENDTTFQHIAWLDVIGNNVKEAFVANQQLIDSLHLRETINSLERNKDYFENAFTIIINRMRKLECDDNAPHNLLIIDNAQQDIEHSQTLDYIALKPHWKVLVTSREDLLGFEKYTLGLLSPTDAKALFYLHYTYKLAEQENADALIDEVLELIDYHTVSIELISKTAQARRLTLDKVLEHLKKKGLAILKDEGDDGYIQFLRNFNQRERKVYAFLLSIFELAGLGEMEQWTAKQFAVMPSMPIRLEGEDRPTLEHLLQIEQGQQRDIFVDSLNSLQKGGWLMHNPEDDAFKMHNLTQEIMREKLKPGYEDCERLCESIIDLLEFNPSKDNPIDKFPWVSFGQTLLNQVILLPAETQRALQIFLASGYRELGNYQKALNLFRVVLENDLKYLEATHPNVALSFSNLALVHQDLGEYEQAQDLLQAALEIAPHEATVQSNLAMVYKALGKYERAQDLLQAALENDLRNYGIGHPNVALTQNNLAMVCQDLGDYEKSQKLLELALESDLQNFGISHPTVAMSQSNLATVYQILGDYKRAQDLFTKALESNLRNFDAKHPKIAISQSNLAMLYQDIKEYERARDLFWTVLESELQNFGASHPTVAITQSNLAMVYRDLGEYKQAQALLQTALKSNLQNFEANHFNVAVNQSNLALACQDLGYYEQARDLLQIALKSHLQNFDANHPDVAKAQSNLASVYISLGNYEKARDLLQVALESNLQNFGASDPIVLDCQSGLAMTCFYLGRKQEAQALFQQVYTTLCAELGENHLDTQTMKEWLDEC